jgi:hypothetical protein
VPPERSKSHDIEAGSRRRCPRERQTHSRAPSPSPSPSRSLGSLLPEGTRRCPARRRRTPRTTTDGDGDFFRRRGAACAEARSRPQNDIIAPRVVRPLQTRSPGGSERGGSPERRLTKVPSDREDELAQSSTPAIFDLPHDSDRERWTIPLDSRDPVSRDVAMTRERG